MIPVLYLAWHFPPVGGAGVQRSLMFARYLPEYGVQPVVLTGPAAPPPPPTPAQRRAQRLTGENRALLAGWRSFLAAAGPQAAADHGARAIVVSLGPYECLLPALELGERLDLPVIADLRDPWALDDMRSYGHGGQQISDRRRMRTQLSRCAFVIMNTPAAVQALHDCVPGLSHERVDFVTNGYQAADFSGPPPAVVRDGMFRIVHTGCLHTDVALAAGRSPLCSLLLGGRRRGVDLWGRTHRYLLRALDRFAVGDPGHAARVELHLYGVSSAADQAEIATSTQRSRVVVHDHRPHAEVVTAMRRADLLFLPMPGLAHGRPAALVPGKTYEYLASGRPILAAVPPGDALDFVHAAGAGIVVAPDDVDGMAVALRRSVVAGRGPDRPLRPSVTRFEWQMLAGKLAGIVRRVLATSIDSAPSASGSPGREERQHA